MKGKLSRLLVYIAISLLPACAAISSSSISQVSGGGSSVSVDHSDYGFLHLWQPETLTTDANSELANKCQSGHITDVQTQLSVREWFGIIQYYTVTATALCKS
jgi:hypothetical protein